MVPKTSVNVWTVNSPLWVFGAGCALLCVAVDTVTNPWYLAHTEEPSVATNILKLHISSWGRRKDGSAW